MTYEQLIVLNAIVNEGTFRAAAEHLHKSQSAISHMLKKLEEEVGVTLLSREQYRPTLTPEGEIFHRQSIRVLQQMRELKSAAAMLASQCEPEVFLAITATMPLGSLLPIIADMGRQYPTTHIRLSREAMGGTVERLLNDDADIIIATMDGVPVEQVEALPLTNVRILPVAHPDFEPARTERTKSMNEMQSYTQVVVADSSHGSLSQTRDVLPGGLRWTVSDFASKKEILLAQLGWGGLPEYMIEDELKNGSLVLLNIDEYPPRHSQLYQIRRRDRAIGCVAHNLWQGLRCLHEA